MVEKKHTPLKLLAKVFALHAASQKTEIEAKFKISTRTDGREPFKEVRRILRAEGAHLVWDSVEKNSFFDTKNESLKAAGIHLRVRTMSGVAGAVLTLKKKHSKKLRANKRYKSRVEQECDFTSRKSAETTLRAIGFSECFSYRKRREHWQLGHYCFVELDTLEDGSRYVEIEASPRKLRRLAKKFGFSINRSYAESYFVIAHTIRDKAKKAF